MYYSSDSRTSTAAFLTIFFLINYAHGLSQTVKDEVAGKIEDKSFSLIKNRLEIKIGEYVHSFTKYLEDFNDKHLRRCGFGTLLHYYEEFKPNLELESARSKPSSAGRMKKMAMAMMPLVFHAGATSIWMMLTSIMAVKSVLIGLMLLIFKIAVSSAKVASFFTQLKLKGKHSDDHHGWSWSPPPHEYHGHDRSFSEIEHNPAHIEHHTDHTSGWHSYAPEWTPNDIPPDYNTISTNYKHADIPLDHENHEEYNGPYLHAEDRKKAAVKKFT